MSNYRLSELVDLAIETPLNGVINFNVLKLILKVILKKSGLSEYFVHYKTPDRKEALIKRILEEGEKSWSEISLQEQKEIDDTLEVMNKIIDDISSSEEIDKVDESTNTVSPIWPVPELEELSTSVSMLKEKLDKVEKNVGSIERRMKRTKKVRVKKTDQEAQEDTEDSRFDLNQEEFEELFENMRDSIRTLANKLKAQEESLMGPASKEAINKLCEKAADEAIAKKQGDFNERLKSLAFTVSNLTNIIKKMINPKAAGVTKCVTCGRSAHLSDFELLTETPKNSRVEPKLLVKDKIKPVKKKESQKKHELKFTLLSLDNIKKAANRTENSLQQDQEHLFTSDVRMKSQDDRGQEKRSVNAFSTDDATSAFMPLRFIPDPTRRGTLLSDVFYINPEVMSVSVLETQNNQQLVFQTKPEKEGNA